MLKVIDCLGMTIIEYSVFVNYFSCQYLKAYPLNILRILLPGMIWWALRCQWYTIWSSPMLRGWHSRSWRPRRSGWWTTVMLWPILSYGGRYSSVGRGLMRWWRICCRHFEVEITSLKFGISKILFKAGQLDLDCSSASFYIRSYYFFSSWFLRWETHFQIPQIVVILTQEKVCDHWSHIIWYLRDFCPQKISPLSSDVVVGRVEQSKRF